MFRNYLKVAVRTLLKNKLFSFINIFGLALSMSICLLVLLRIKDQVGYDKNHPQPDLTYRVITQVSNQEGDVFRYATTPVPFLKNFRTGEEVIATATQLFMPGQADMRFGKKELPVNKVFADSSFFSVFGFTLQSGNPTSALNAPNTIVIDEPTALRFFGRKDVLGEQLYINDWGSFLITGLLSPSSGKSHIDYQAYVSLSTVAGLEKTGKLPSLADTWNELNSNYTYLVVKNGVSGKQLSKMMDVFSASLMSGAQLKGKESMQFEAQGLNDIILGEELQRSIGQTGSMGKTMAEIIIAFVILLSACFNYTNLSIARSFNRGKEIGVRKVSGAFRSHIFLQFLIESLLVSLLALGMAYIFLQWMIDYAPFSGELVPEGFAFDGSLFGWFFIFTIFTSLIAGAIPAWALSSFKPALVLKNLANIRLFGGQALRKGLMITQFSLSLVIIVFAQIFSRQFDFMDKADPGFARENRIAVPLQGGDRKLMTQEIGKISGVEMVASSSDPVGHHESGMSKIRLHDGDQPLAISYYDIDSSFLTLMEIGMLAGENITETTVASNEQKVLLNERALELLRLGSATEAIGKSVLVDDSVRVTIAGIVQNFYFRGVDEFIPPLMLRSRESQLNLLTVKLNSPDPELVKKIGQTFSQVLPGQTFSYTWLQPTKKTGETLSMLSFLAFIAVTLAGLGLLGMVTYSITLRTKEIGIRKIMGASVGEIMKLVSKGFIRLVLVAGLIGIPISYLAGYFFLNIFANRISQGITVQLLSLSGLLLLALIIIASQLIKVALANPVKSLRHE